MTKTTKCTHRNLVPGDVLEKLPNGAIIREALCKACGKVIS